MIVENGNWETTVSYNWQSGYQDQEVLNAFTGTPLPIRRVSALETWDLGLRYTGIKNLELSAQVSNLFDRDPPFSQQNSYFQVGYDSANSNPRGRTIGIGAKYKFW
jgi:iron complex outermembrane recepter protein